MVSDTAHTSKPNLPVTHDHYCRVLRGLNVLNAGIYYSHMFIMFILSLPLTFSLSVSILLSLSISMFLSLYVCLSVSQCVPLSHAVLSRVLHMWAMMWFCGANHLMGQVRSSTHGRRPATPSCCLLTLC